MVVLTIPLLSLSLSHSDTDFFMLLNEKALTFKWERNMLWMKVQLILRKYNIQPMIPEVNTPWRQPINRMNIHIGKINRK